MEKEVVDGDFEGSMVSSPCPAYALECNLDCRRSCWDCGGSHLLACALLGLEVGTLTARKCSSRRASEISRCTVQYGLVENDAASPPKGAAATKSQAGRRNVAGLIRKMRLFVTDA